MDNQNIYEISFVGQDYQPLNNAAATAVIKRGEEEYIINPDGQILSKNESNNNSDPARCREILDQLLYDIAPNGNGNYPPGIHINVSETTKKKTQKLYDPSFGAEGNRGYFCGVIGIIRKQISVTLYSDDEENKYLFNATLQIKSRLDVDENNNIGKPYFLSTLLLRDKIELNDNTVPNNEDEILDYLLLFWFKTQLQRACLKGYYKTYRKFERNDDRVRGNIDVARHIRMNMGQNNGKIAYSYRENTIDNYLNQLIVAAYHHLKNKYYDLVADNFDNNIDLKNSIDFLSYETNYSASTTNSLINKNAKTISHPYFTEYEELRLTCIKILRDEGISIFDGNSSQETQGILFYLPDLWEEFLEDEVINNNIPAEILCKSQYQVLNFGFWENGTYTFKQNTFPDFVFFNNNQPFMILDAKFKPRWIAAFEGEPLSEVMEDYNKCIRDMVATNSHATGVIFPIDKEVEINDSNTRHRISEYNNTDYFYTIPVYVPCSKGSYSEWSARFKESLNNSAGFIKTAVQSERDYSEATKVHFEKLNR